MLNSRRRQTSFFRKTCFIFLKLMIFSSGLTTTDAQITSYRVENSETISSVSADGQLTLFALRSIDLRIFSNNPITWNSEISFTNMVSSTGSDCNDLRKSDIFHVYSTSNKTALVTITLSKSDALLGDFLMFCYREGGTGNGTKSKWMHQGDEKWMRISVVIGDDETRVVLIWVKSFLVPLFLFLSALFSGLSLNLLSLTRSELKVLRNQGTSEEKMYSRAVSPLRKRGNVLFCSLLLMNTLANVIVVVLLYELVRLYSILAATLLIVFLGEILPQAICSKYGLSFGNKMGWVTNVFFVLTLPFSYPVGKLLDAVLNNEVPAVYNRDRFQEMMSKSQKANTAATAMIIDATSNKDAEDIKTFKLSNKTVGDVMVKLEDAFMEEYDSVLTAYKVAEILKRGYTRIPVYEKERSNVVALLHIRDLTLIDPKDELTLKTVCKFYNRPVNFVFEDTKLTIMLEEFKKGQSHMAFVQRVNSEGLGDPYYETLGMITLEDVIEDIFHSDSVANRQIVNSVFDPNIHFQNSEITSGLEKLKFNQYLALHKKSKSVNTHRHGSGEDGENHVENLPHNLLEAIKNFLPTVAAFRPNLISASVLERLLKQSTVIKVQGSGSSQETSSSRDGPDRSYNNKAVAIVEKGKAMDCLVLILEGKVEVTIGAEHFNFTEGTFAHFGHQALMNALSCATVASSQQQSKQNEAGEWTNQADYIPDFSVRPIADVVYLRVPSPVYLSSLQATLLQRLSQIRDSGSDISALLPPSMPQQVPSVGGGDFDDDEAFVEANNARNVFLNGQELQDFQRNIGFPGPVQFSGNCDYLIDPRLEYHYGNGPSVVPITAAALPPNYSYHLGVWMPYQPQENLVAGGDKVDSESEGKAGLSKSPSSEWMARHTKPSAEDGKDEALGSQETIPGDNVIDGGVHPVS